ncbi:MAG: EFR1 family ferrodoxin [Oscillospiraceae bacterium]|nr:EFR1 family ferrodoxin [Oscillospiraceae bacterium]
MKNIIYCYSGSGNCLDMAKNIAAMLGSTDIVMMRAYPEINDASSYDRVGFVFPCYGGGLPGEVESYVKDIQIAPNAYKFAVVQYAGYMGCGLHKIDRIVGLDYWAGVSNHCSAIWLMPHYLTFPPTSLSGAQKRSEAAAAKIALDIVAQKKSSKKPPKRILNQAESAGFQKINQKINGKMCVSDQCVACGQCVKLCPKGNIHLVAGKASIGKNCIGCMSCIEYCPQKAINVGKITKKRERFHNANVAAADLMEKVIHIG